MSLWMVRWATSKWLLWMYRCGNSHQAGDVAPSILFQWILKVTSCVSNTNKNLSLRIDICWDSRRQRNKQVMAAFDRSTMWLFNTYVCPFQICSLKTENHYNDVIMGSIAPQITSLIIVIITQPFIRTQIKENIKAMRHWPLCGNSPGTVNSPHKLSVTRKMFPFDDVIMIAIDVLQSIH